MCIVFNLARPFHETIESHTLISDSGYKHSSRTLLGGLFIHILVIGRSGTREGLCNLPSCGKTEAGCSHMQLQTQTQISNTPALGKAALTYTSARLSLSV